MCQGDLAVIDQLRFKLPALTMDTFPGLGFRAAEKTAAKGGEEQLAEEFKAELSPSALFNTSPFLSSPGPFPSGIYQEARVGLRPPPPPNDASYKESYGVKLGCPTENDTSQNVAPQSEPGYLRHTLNLKHVWANATRGIGGRNDVVDAVC